MISVLGFDALEARYAKELQAMQALISETIAKVRSAGDIMVSIARPFSNSLKQLGSASDTHLRLSQYDGVLLLSGVKPRADYYGVSVEDTREHCEIRLVPVV